MKKLFIVLGIIGMFTFGGGLVAATPVGAAAKDEILGATDKVNDGNATDLNATFKTVVNLLLFAVGAISTIMIILGGIKYTTSNGDQGAVQSAKNTIMYAVIGLIVAIIAFAIVNFVVTQFM